MKGKKPSSKAVLVIGGSDCSSGAGIQRDLKVFYEQRIYAASVVTCVTAQNSSRLIHYEPVSEKLLIYQLEAVFEEFEIQFVKIGMLGSSRIVEKVARFLGNKQVTIVYDPVLQASSGGALADTNFIKAIRTELFPMVTLLTPNQLECERILDCSIEDWNDKNLRNIYKESGVRNLLIKGGHASGTESIDYLITGDCVHRFSKPRLSKEVRGTGCSLSSYITGELFWGKNLVEAVQNGKNWLWKKMYETNENKFL